MKGLSLHKLNAGYQKKNVICDLSLPELQRGKITIILGPNGCGKSTLLRALAGLNKANGKVFLDGVNLMQMPFSARADSTIFLPQFLPHDVHLKVLESILVSLRASKMGGKHEKTQSIAILKQLGIEHLAFCYLDQLSGGQRQLVGLAQSLVRNPSILLLDEPLSALDLNHQFHVMDLVKSETRNRNIVTIMVVHDLNIALRYGDYVVMLKKGKLIASGKPKEVITPENLANVYRIRGRLEHCSRGLLQLIVDGVIPD
ncbi:ABC transporter ATP-binding protein [Escherichia albertii]|uniref:ABC transporter ATP-binding protein n=1 Tax=Escherichia albertii TaxID=208962 RepID=A0ABX5HCH2_ESCAL|nr:ABC transporter ATP-binding protein [Escherichia albertii]PSY37449.1 ABC transporter ATP-binding protein [Escherichia albertii]